MKISGLLLIMGMLVLALTLAAFVTAEADAPLHTAAALHLTITNPLSPVP